MSETKVAIKLSTLDGICDAVREVENTTELIPIEELKPRILALGEEENKIAQFADGSITELTEKDLKGVTEIQQYAFYNSGNNLTKVSLPDSVKKINKYAFYYCSNLSELPLNQVEELCEFSFYGCENLEEIISPFVKNIGKSVFSNCNNLRVLKLTNPDLILDDASSLVYRTKGVPPDVYFSLSLEDIYCFDSNNTAGIFNGCEGYRLFINDELVENPVFSNAVTKITRNGVRGNYGIKTVTFLGDITEICDWGFAYCENLEKISFPNCSSVPVLKGYNLLESRYSPPKVNCVIEVPSALYDEWIASTNWSNSKIASKIVAIEEASE